MGKIQHTADGEHVTLSCECGNIETKHENGDWHKFKTESGWLGEGCTMINYWCFECHHHEKRPLFQRPSPY